jgi:Flp pilus assembly protein TadD
LGRLKFEQQPGGQSSVAPLRFARLFTEKIPLFILSGAAGVATLFAQSGDNAVISLHSIPLLSRIGNTVMGYAGYLEKMIFPVNLCVYYPLPGEIPASLATGSAFVILAISLLVWRARKEHHYLLVGWLWYLLMLLPVIGLVQVSGQAMADRYTYVPLVGVFIMIVWSLTPFFESWTVRRPIKTALIGAVLAACLAGTAAQLRHWRNGIWLFAHCVEVAPDSFLAHHNLGCALSARGHKAEAVAEYTESLRLYPNNAKVHYSLAMDLADLGQASEAIAHYSEAARLRPRDASTHLNWGVLLAQEGRVAEASEHFVAAIKLEPENAPARLNLANALNQQGRTADALAQYRATLDLAPTWPQALNRLAFVLATHQEAKFRDGATAVRLAEAANKLTAETQPALMNTLAAAYAEAGHFDKAVAAGQRAWQLALNSSQNTLIPQIQNCLQLYREGKPYHEEPPANADQKLKIQD